MINSIHALRVGADYHAKLINLEELLNLVRTVTHHIVLFQRISHGVGMHTKSVLGGCWV